jgi:hypothetical protein
VRFEPVWEVVRVGNGHMTSIRAATQDRWIHHYVEALMYAGFIGTSPASFGRDWTHFISFEARLLRARVIPVALILSALVAASLRANGSSSATYER